MLVKTILMILRFLILRRDTPHHLKNKRVSQGVDKERVATIIAQVHKTIKKEKEKKGWKNFKTVSQQALQKGGEHMNGEESVSMDGSAEVIWLLF